MARKKQSDKGREILKSKKVFPDLNPMDYDGSLRLALNFYSDNVDSSVKKAAALAWWKKQGKDTSKVSKLGEGWFITCGAVAHMASRGCALDKKHLQYLDKKYLELCNVKQEVEDTKPVQVVSKEDKQASEVSKHIAEFEAGIDSIVKGGAFDAKSYLVKNEVKPVVVKQIATWFKPLLKELKAVDTDAQLKESYSHLSKRAFNKFREQVEGVVASCDVAVALTKAARKPRVQKAKPAAVVAAKVKYMQSYPALKLTSVAPAKLVNSDEIWLLNVKVRRLFKYVPLQGSKLSVKGTTITGFDPEKSGGKILRKPEEQLKGIESMTSRPLNSMYNGVRAVASKATGRISEDHLILKVF